MPTTLEAVRAEALFVWCLQAPSRPAPDHVRDAVSTTLRRLGMRGCAALVAEEFGEHPDTAVNRMTWALDMIHTVYPADSSTDVADERPAELPLALALAN